MKQLWIFRTFLRIVAATIDAKYALALLARPKYQNVLATVSWNR
jgi:hypothetical protein